MEGAKSLNSDHFLRQLGGCGLFQAIHGVCVSLVHICTVFGSIFMAYGNYNPGWKCVDNSTTTKIFTNVTTTATITYKSLTNDGLQTPILDSAGNFTSREKFMDSCDGFSDCGYVVFNPEANTVATEWGLVCGQSWKNGIIFSMQMAGATFGNLVGGYLSDLNAVFQAVLNFLSALSPQCEIFAAIRFFLGMSQGMMVCITYVYMAEFSAPKWGIAVSSLPLWCFGCVLFFSCALVLKDWKHLHIVTGILMLVGLIPAFFLPDSLRWLIIKNKQKKALRAVKQIAKINRAEDPSKELLASLASKQRKGNNNKQNNENTLYNFVRLFHKGTRGYTTILATILFISNLIYMATSLGVSSLPGDVYINSIIVYATELPANIIVVFIGNTFGRKPSGALTSVAQAISFLIYVAFHFLGTGSFRNNGMLVFIIMVRICLEINWFIAFTCACELYPTVMRTMAFGWIALFAGVGSVLSPYLITIDPKMESMYISVTIMAVLSLTSGVLFCLLPETKGKDLKDDMDLETHSAKEMKDVEGDDIIEAFR